MEQEQDPSAEYIKGFNSGYNLSKHEPNLTNTLIKDQKVKSEYYKGLLAGKKQLELEMLKKNLENNKDISREYN